MRFRSTVLCAVLAAVCFNAQAELPAPPTDWAPWSMEWSGGAPGLFSATDLLDKPAGKNGSVVARDGHFYTGDKRIRFWGVNIAFAGCFPTHENADAVAHRLAGFGINAVRLHHMDMMTFPNGIFADGKGEKLSDEALDRLDYFVAALKKEGVYSNVNLHVSRNWSKTHGWENAEKLPESYDKMLDIFQPDLIAANKQYAKDLLTHVNKYTNTRYADEPAVCMVEINNEDTLFLWGGEQALAKLPEPYAGQLQKLWNDWLTKKYGSREKLMAAWRQGAQPLGENLLADEDFKSLGQSKPQWNVEAHAPAKMTGIATPLQDGHTAIRLLITEVDGTDWHLQFNQGSLKLQAAHHYTVSFFARADEATTISVGVSQAHAPWKNLGLAAPAKLDAELKRFYFGFDVPETDENARISFAVGSKATVVAIGDVSLREGGQRGLTANEDLTAGTVVRGGTGQSSTQARSNDWYDFLQQTDEAYWVDMRRFLRDEIGVKAPITGSIGLGPLGTLSQSKMDFVDAHAYWDHPKFPHKSWDMKDWQINNKPMVDNPAGATLWGLAATRVAGKPFTVTEYNHAAPNDWQAECVPMIAAYAALQDWDGVYLFAYSHSGEFEKKKISSFFDIEGNPAKMAFMPLAARMFLGQGVTPSEGVAPIKADHEQMLKTASAYYYTIWPWAQSASSLQWHDALTHRVAIDFHFQRPAATYPVLPDDKRIEWSADGAGTGRFLVNDAHGIVYVGFGKDPVTLGPVRVEGLQSPFVALMLVPADPKQTIESASHLLLAVVGRTENTGMTWQPDRKSVSDQWGNTPPLVEVICGRLTLQGERAEKVFAVNADGKRGAQLLPIGGGKAGPVELGKNKTIWYEIER